MLEYFMKGKQLHNCFYPYDVPYLQLSADAHKKNPERTTLVHYGLKFKLDAKIWPLNWCVHNLNPILKFDKDDLRAAFKHGINMELKYITKVLKKRQQYEIY